MRQDRTLLLQIDALIDQLSEDIAEELWPAIAVAFERAEDADLSFGPIHPGTRSDPRVWTDWRTLRDAHLGRAAFAVVGSQTAEAA